MTMQSKNIAEAAQGNGYQRRRQETRRQLMAAALELFVTRGLQQVSIDAITSAAGVAKGSFYNHFESREALFAELVEVRLENLLQKHKEYSPPFEDRLERGLARVWYVFYTLLSDPVICRLLLLGEPPVPGGYIDRVLRACILDEVLAGIALGTLAHLDRELVYASWFGVVTQAIGYLLARGEDLDAAAAADDMTELSFAVWGLPHHTPPHYLGDTQDASSA